MGLEAAALFDPLFGDGEFDAVEPVVERGVRSRLGNEQEMAANRLDGLANRLAGIEIVADIDRLNRARPGPWAASQRRAARLSQSCFSCPSWGTTTSGASGIARA